MRDKALVAAFEAGKGLAEALVNWAACRRTRLRVSLVNYCSTVLEDHEEEPRTAFARRQVGRRGAWRAQLAFRGPRSERPRR